MVCCVFCGRSYNASSIKKNISFHRVPSNVSTLWLNFGQKHHDFLDSNFKKNNLVCSLHFEKQCFNFYNKSIRLKVDSIPSIVVHRVKHAKEGYPELMYASSSLNLQQTYYA